MSAPQRNEPNVPVKQSLESKKYFFLVDGTMPTLEFDISSGRAKDEGQRVSQHLTLELYNPLAGEVFEAKFPKGRIEVDNDGSITYFSSNAETVNLSLFLGHNIQLSMNKKTGEVLIKSPSKIVSVEQDIRSGKQLETAEVTSDSIKLRLE